MYRNTIIPQTSPTMPPRVAAPSRRHGAPSGPWPFVDIGDEVDPDRIEDPDSHLPMSASPCEHAQTQDQEFCWCKYPQALYPNWTPRQQKKSGIARFVERKHEICTIHYLDVMKDGIFRNPGEREVNERTQDTQWLAIQRGRGEGVSVRALFVEGLSGHVLQMLGTRYNIEPFYFSSTIGWIPSRFQSNKVASESDHITITLSFIRAIQNPTTVPPSPNPSFASSINRTKRAQPDLIIDTQAPLPLRSSNILLLADLLAIHMVRSPAGNTIISLHPSSEHRATTADTLHTRVHLTGRSVYWSNILKDSTDPTFVLLSLFWYALYAWDETLEHMYNHLCFLEYNVIATNDIQMTTELHVIRAHLLHYQSLLEDFTKSVEFILETPNPSMECADEPIRKQSQAMMRRECRNMLTEIDRLERSRQMQEKRLKNVMELEFSSVNIEDSRRMQKLTEAASQDSAAMKQIAYLSMAFVPATFVAGVFGMNVSELNGQGPLDFPHYIAVALPLTVVTIWIVVAYQIQITEPVMQTLDEQGRVEQNQVARYKYYNFGRNDSEGTSRKLNIWARLWWPAILFSSIFEKRKRRRAQTRIDAMSPGY